jgi:hypothetical protein
MGQPPQQPGWGYDPAQRPYGQYPHDQPTPVGQPPRAPLPPPPYGQPQFPPPYGQPQYPQQYGQPPGRSGGGRTAGIVLAIVGALLLLGGGGTVVAYLAGAFGGEGGGPLGGGGRGPVETVEEFWTAAGAGDCETAIELVTEESWSQGGEVTREESLADCRESFDSTDIPIVEEVTLISEDGDTAIVEATMTVPDVDSQTFRHELIREDGAWKIDEFDLGF